MEIIFETLIQVLMAYFQIVMIVFGLLFFLFGASAFLSTAQKKKSKRYWLNATVCAIREGEGLPDPDTQARSKIYYPVFEAVRQDGNMHQYECKSGSANINKFKVGTRYQVELSKTEENFVSIKGDDRNNLFIGTFLCSMGAAMFGLPVYFIPFSKLTFIVWALTAIVMGFKFSKYIKPKAFWQTVELFKARRNRERLAEHQSKPAISTEYIRIENNKLHRVEAGMSKISLVVGFVILCLGGAGYNGQLNFIDNAVLIKTGPCGLELGEDCPRTILYTDALSIIPIEFRPVMEGVYHNKYDPEQMIVSYGRWTPLPYFILLALGALTILSVIRKSPQVK